MSRFDLTSAQINAITRAISQPRLEPYIRACFFNRRLAIDLYRWNAEISGAFLAPIQLCEVTVRNAIVETLERVYGHNWPWSSAFERSLPDPRPPSGRPIFSPRRELVRTRNRMTLPGKVVAELKFAFWVELLTRRHNDRLWRPYIRNSFPNLPERMTSRDAIIILHNQLDKVKDVRNRIAHHEPIFKLDVQAQYKRIISLIHFCNQPTELWVQEFQDVTKLIKKMP